MAATANVRVIVELDGLGPGVIDFARKFTDSATPDNYRRIDTVISTTAILLSSICNIPSAQILGMGIMARGDIVFINTISTTISTAGLAIPENQANFMSFTPGNSCKISFKGNAADSAVTGIIYAALTV